VIAPIAAAVAAAGERAALDRNNSIAGANGMRIELEWPG
jgi:hypothetical protein